MNRTPEAMDAHHERISRQRRLALEIRTVTITLRTALDDLERDVAVPADERIRLRLEWCERARVLIQNVRARSFRISRLTSEIAAYHADPMEARRATETALRLLDESEAQLASLSKPA